ncbi:hypothetical protein PHISP_03589 [Aspergillus sp. HF37]|nr:hypothetical protein PHISP_03589 [Aspergillus sp. HF37]
MYCECDTSNRNLNLMPIPLGDLTAGKYTIYLNFTGRNISYDVVDYVLGYPVESTIDNSNGSARITFTLDDDLDAVSLAGTTEKDDV